MKKNVPVLVSFLLFGLYLFPGKLAVLSQVENADYLYVDQRQILVGENTSVLIYSAENFQLQAEFGKKGEGPAEFLPIPGRGLWIDVDQETIFIHSLGKISYFKRDGTFIKEQRIPPGTYFFKSLGTLGSPLVGFKTTAEKDVIYETINLFDHQLNLQKELFRHKARVQPNSGEIKVLDRSVVIETGGEKVFVSAGNHLEVLVFDKKGDLIHTIENTAEKGREVTDRDRKEIHDFLKQKYGDAYPLMKDNVKIPPVYPVIRSRVGLEYDEGSGVLYVITWNREGSRNICFLYDHSGKFLRKVNIEMKSATPILPYPFVIRDGKFYQLEENEETEDWELLVSEIGR